MVDIIHFMACGGGGYGATTNALGKIQYAVQETDYIYIFDKFIYSRDYPNEDIYNVYYKTSIENSENYIGEKDVDINNAIEFLYNDLYMYKHTFKKSENGEYYWVSTEKYEENS